MNAVGLTPTLGYCMSRDACLELLELGGSCFYADGSSFRTGTLACEGCAGAEGVVCGPGCAGCPAGQECIGPSELSGIGVCLPVVDHFVLFDACGPVDPWDPWECDAGMRCLRYATPSTLVSDMPGYCIEASRCAQLELARPDRFRCE